MGFRQQLPKERKRYYFILIMRFIIFSSVLNLLGQTLLQSINHNKSKGYLIFIWNALKFILPLITMYCLKLCAVLDQRICLSQRSAQRLRIFSYSLFFGHILNIIFNFILEFIKFFYLKNQYFLIALTKGKLDTSNIGEAFNQFTKGFQFYVLIQYQIEISCLYTIINCLIISTMFTEINQHIISYKFKMNPNDLRKIQLNHSRITEQITRLTTVLSTSLFIMYFHLMTNICQFTFHIVSYIRDPASSGMSLQ